MSSTQDPESDDEQLPGKRPASTAASLTDLSEPSTVLSPPTATSYAAVAAAPSSKSYAVAVPNHDEIVVMALFQTMNGCVTLDQVRMTLQYFESADSAAEWLWTSIGNGDDIDSSIEALGGKFD